MKIILIAATSITLGILGILDTTTAQAQVITPSTPSHMRPVTDEPPVSIEWLRSEKERRNEAESEKTLITMVMISTLIFTLIVTYLVLKKNKYTKR